MNDDDRSIESRLSEVKKLKAGWFDGQQGQPVAPHVLDALERFKRWLIGRGRLPNPYIYPTLEGGLRLEWEFGPWAVEGELSPKGQVAATADNLDTDESHEQELSWRDENWPEHLSCFVARFWSSDRTKDAE